MSRPHNGLGLVQRPEQRMLLQPRMLQSIEVLQLSTAELADWVERAAEQNEALSIEERPRAPLPSRVTRASREATDRHDELLASAPDRSRGLAESLVEQLSLVDVPAELAPWVRLCVDSLDDHGYLSPSDEALLALARERGIAGPPERADEDLGRLGRAIGIVQKLEPRGVGGRDAVEALLLQLDPRDPDYALLCALLEDFLEDVARNKLPSVARALGIDLARLEELLGALRRLDLRPAGEAEAGEGSPPIRPEVVVTAVGADRRGFEVKVENAGLPAVSIDPGIERVANDRARPRELRSYLRDKLASARDVVAAVEQRRRTLLRIASAVFARQRAFLAEGPGHLAPLSMGEIADELALSVSTVSRAVAGKHADTPWGTFPLRWFFQAAAGSGEASREDVRAAVGALIAGEDRSRPLSDDEIVERLRARGADLARRTVAKYRQELGIPSSYRRRKH